MGQAKGNAAIPTFSKNAITVLEKRYLKRDLNGKPLEEPADLFRRVAAAIASADTNFNPKANVSPLADDFYRMMTGFEFLPNSPTRCV